MDARDRLLHAATLRRTFAAAHPEAAGLDKTAAELEESLTNLMRRTAKPQPCLFEIRRTGK